MTLDPVRDHYDAAYARAKPDNGLTPLLRALRRFTTDRLQVATRLAPGGCRVLDIGCGYGQLLLALNPKYAELYGVDIAAEPVARIKENWPNIRASVQNADAALDFPDGYFDTITLLATLEHVFDPYRVVRTCHRLLAPGGALIVEVPNVAWLPRRLTLLAGKMPGTSGDPGWDGGHLHYFTRATLCQLLRDCGFTVRRVSCSGAFAGPRRLWGSLLAADVVVLAVKTADTGR